MESALQALELLGVDITNLKETKLKGEIYTHGGSGYWVGATEAKSA